LQLNVALLLTPLALSLMRTLQHLLFYYANQSQGLQMPINAQPLGLGLQLVTRRGGYMRIRLSTHWINVLINRFILFSFSPYFRPSVLWMLLHFLSIFYCFFYFLWLLLFSFFSHCLL